MSGRDGVGQAGRASQLEIFRPRREVSKLNPKKVIGRQTAVDRMFRVRYEGEKAVHQVVHDHHGWYCTEHGPDCTAVFDALERVRGKGARRSADQRPERPA